MPCGKTGTLPGKTHGIPDRNDGIGTNDKFLGPFSLARCLLRGLAP
jgi:hypothetical protein